MNRATMSLLAALCAAMVVSAMAAAKGAENRAVPGHAPAAAPAPPSHSRPGTPGRSTSGPSVASPRAQTARRLPSHYVLAVYFHRTHRCPTCLKIGSCIEQAIRQGFAEQMQQGTVRLRLIDFQTPQNARIAAARKIDGPTLVIIDVRDGRVAAWRKMPRVWSLLADQDEFFAYVQGGVRAYLEQQ